MNLFSKLIKSRKAPEEPVDPGPVPPLVNALSALLCAVTPVEGGPSSVAPAFAAAVRKMDAADAAYRDAIGRILAEMTAHDMIAAMGSYRDAVAAIRDRAREATGYGDFDPLDTYVPAMRVSHGDSVRIAAVADRARAEVDEMRTQVNARIGSLLSAAEIAQLTDAKQLRNAAFEAAVTEALGSRAGDRLVAQLKLLADGWY